LGLRKSAHLFRGELASLATGTAIAGYDRLLLPGLFLGGWLVLWEIGLNLLRVFQGNAFPRVLYPTPSEIFASFYTVQTIDDVSRPLWATIAHHLPITLFEIAVGFAIGLLIGLLAGSLIGISNLLGRIIYPTAIIIKSVPIIAVAPLLVVWFGFGISSKVAATAIVTLFPIIVSTASGIKATDPTLMELMASISATRRQTFLKVQLPQALPLIFAGIKIAITLAVVGAVVGEFVAPGEGLGYLVVRSMDHGYAGASFALFAVLSVLGLLLFTAVTLIERRVVFWSETAKTKIAPAEDNQDLQGRQRAMAGYPNR
jgi:NitT/TauT family transport system permease protein